MNETKGQHGLTLVELIISLAIAALLVPLVAGIIFILQFLPQRTQADIQAQQNLQLVGQWVTLDATRAETFSNAALPPDEYGVFSWTEYGGTLPASIQVTYLYDPATTSLMRKVTRDGVVDRTSVVAQNIANFGDVVFTSTDCFGSTPVRSPSGQPPPWKRWARTRPF